MWGGVDCVDEGEEFVDINEGGSEGRVEEGLEVGD